MDHLHQQHEHQQHEQAPGRNGVLSRAKPVLIVFLLIAGYFLWTEHRAHTIAYLPVLLLLACPLMHIFMHGGHGGHSGQGSSSGDQDSKGGQ